MVKFRRIWVWHGSKNWFIPYRTTFNNHDNLAEFTNQFQNVSVIFFSFFFFLLLFLRFPFRLTFLIALLNFVYMCVCVCVYFKNKASTSINCNAIKCSVNLAKSWKITEINACYFMVILAIQARDRVILSTNLIIKKLKKKKNKFQRIRPNQGQANKRQIYRL